ncbi:MAG: hypothetical protein EOP41_06420 [Sphingobacteriaceae bacterium]|nr:MAG: hypothetical protein EOP41_06420 [Sphingobacteriaceae bacterium]
MPYFSHATNAYATKNNLEAAIQKCIKEEFDRVVLDDTGLEAFQDNVLTRISALNRQHQRCIPIQASWIKHRALDNGDFELQIPHIIRFYVYKSR